MMIMSHPIANNNIVNFAYIILKLLGDNKQTSMHNGATVTTPRSEHPEWSYTYGNTIIMLHCICKVSFPGPLTTKKGHIGPQPLTTSI